MEVSISKLAALTVNHISLIQKNDDLADHFVPSGPEDKRLEEAIAEELESGRQLCIECAQHLAAILEHGETAIK